MEMINANTNKEKFLSCEQLHIADTYLECFDLQETSSKLDLPLAEVEKFLGQKPVIRYIDRIFNETGYRNKDKLFGLLDKIIESKLEEAEESEVYSNKDLLEVLATLHKMKLEEMKMSIKLLEAEAGKGPNVVVNTQNNYSTLMSDLLDNK